MHKALTSVNAVILMWSGVGVTKALGITSSPEKRISVKYVTSLKSSFYSFSVAVAQLWQLLWNTYVIFNQCFEDLKKD